MHISLPELITEAPSSGIFKLTLFRCLSDLFLFLSKKVW